MTSILNLAPEAAGTTPLSAEAAPAYPLYDADAVLLATLLGGPPAGAILLALNYRRLGRPGAAAAALALGFALGATVLYVVLLLSPSWSWKETLSLGLLLLTLAVRGSALQARAVAQHAGSGGPRGSLRMAAGLGVVFLLASLALFFAERPPSILAVGTADHVLYTGFATRADAGILARELTQIGIFTNTGADVVFTKGPGGRIVSFVVRDGIWDDAPKVEIYKAVTRYIAPRIGGLPLKLRLVDVRLHTHKEVVVQ